jgi:hypothetical protein
MFIFFFEESYEQISGFLCFFKTISVSFKKYGLKMVIIAIALLIFSK